MYNIILAHGWGFSGEFFESLASYLIQIFLNSNVQYLEKSYFNQKASHITLDKSKKTIGIGHCLGFANLIESDIKFDYLVAISAFTKFCNNSTKILDKTIAAFANNPLKVLDNFYINCIGGRCTVNQKDINSDLLLSDLKNLKDINITDQINKLICPILSIATKNDRILEIIHFNNNNSNITKITHENSMHGIGFLEAKWCADEIKTFLQNNDRSMF